MVLCSLVLNAQEIWSRFHWGIAAPIAAKIALLPVGGAAYHPWGNAGICVEGLLEGQEEQSLSLLLRTGITLDITQYKATAYASLITNRGALLLNPEILFPLRSPRMKILGGIGIEADFYRLAQWNPGPDVGIDNSSWRRIRPFCSAGFRYDLKRSVHVSLFARQALMKYFAPGTSVSFSQSGGTMLLSEQPTLLGFSLDYFF